MTILFKTGGNYFFYLTVQIKVTSVIFLQCYLLVFQTGRNFFMHFFAPVSIPTYPKSVLFLVDTSGSMAGTKITQTKSAILEILDTLDAQDTFNIITFSTWLRFWEEKTMMSASASNIASAKNFINGITVTGGKLPTHIVTVS